MASTLDPYISFRHQAREAMQYYQSVFGGDLTSNTFAEFNAATDPSESDNIMHSQLTTPAGFTLMGADIPAAMDLQQGQSITVSLNGDDESERADIGTGWQTRRRSVCRWRRRRGATPSAC